MHFQCLLCTRCAPARRKQKHEAYRGTCFEETGLSAESTQDVPRVSWTNRRVRDSSLWLTTFRSANGSPRPLPDSSSTKGPIVPERWQYRLSSHQTKTFELLRMYTMWANKNGYKVNEIDYQAGEVAGIKSVILEIEGDFAFGMLKGENGVHRLVRVSPFNSQGKRMTSFCSVFVHPIVDDSIEIIINPADLEWDTFRAQGAGGQHVNKTESAVRVTHVPTNTIVECQQQRSQIQNRETAMKMLKSKLYELEMQKKLEARDAVEAQKMKNEWGSQIRSYVLDDRWVKDLRSGYKVTNPDAVLNGDLNGFFKAYLLHKEQK